VIIPKGVDLILVRENRIGISMIRNQLKQLAGTFAIAFSASLTTNCSLAQSIESDPAPPRGQFTAPVSDQPAPQYLIPDVPPQISQQLKVDRHWFSLTPGLVLIGDYNAFGQDAASLSQVGKQVDQFDDRAIRFMARGKVGGAYKMGYLVAAEYKGFDTDPEQLWNLTDLAVTAPIGGPETTVSVGKLKETFAYEMVGDAANLPAQERVLSPFFVSRNNGIRLNRVLGQDHRATAAIGVYDQDWGISPSSVNNGTDVTFRTTGLLWDLNEDRDYFHVGLAGRYNTSADGAIRMRGRPESNVTSNYVDTGGIPASYAWNFGLELLWNRGPFSALAEYTPSWISSDVSGNPNFYGCYILTSWVLTGESRPYDRTVGYARRIIPKHRFGAVELVGRFSNVDLEDEEIHGGEFYKTYFGTNWWATRRAKFGIGWGHTWLDRFGTIGETDHLQVRTQFVY
jgi:phosphate-selective porin OprO/OprP